MPTFEAVCWTVSSVCNASWCGVRSVQCRAGQGSARRTQARSGESAVGWQTPGTGRGRTQQAAGELAVRRGQRQRSAGQAGAGGGAAVVVRGSRACGKSSSSGGCGSVSFFAREVSPAPMELLTTDLIPIRAPKHPLSWHRLKLHIFAHSTGLDTSQTKQSYRRRHSTHSPFLASTPRHSPRHVPPTRHWPVQGLTHHTVPEVPPARPLQLRMQGQGAGPSLQVAPIAHPAAAQSVTEAQAHHRGPQRPRAQEGRRRRHPQEEGRGTGARDWPQAQQE